MTVIAGLVMDIVAFHSLEPYDDILQGLVPARPYMGRISYKRWTVQKVEVGFFQESSFCLLVGLASLHQWRTSSSVFEGLYSRLILPTVFVVNCSPSSGRSFWNRRSPASLSADDSCSLKKLREVARSNLIRIMKLITVSITL